MVSPTGRSMGAVGGGVVIGPNGVEIAPQRAYTSLEQWERSFRTSWSSVAELAASLQFAPPATGLPDDAPSPNTVYQEANGLLYRFIVDPDYTRQPFVADDEVRERLQFRKQHVALSIQEAQAKTDKRRAEHGDPEWDFWCGFTWIRGGYSPERWAPVEVQRAAVANGNAPLVFDQPASPTDAARIRHEVANMDRRTATLPIEEAPRPKRGRKAAPDAAPPPSTDDAHDNMLAAAIAATEG